MKKSTIKKGIIATEESGAGHFNLFPLFTCATEHPKLVRDSEGENNDPYQSAVDKLLEDAHIPHAGGWFIEGKFSDEGFWQSRSIGRVLLGEGSNLFTRLRDELYKEYIAIHAEVYGKRKMGVYFVMWVVAPDWMTDKDIRLVETVLIDKFRPGYDGKSSWIEKKLSYNEAISVRLFVETMEDEIGRILGQKYPKGR